MFIKRLLISLLLLLPTNSFAADSTVSSLIAASALGGTELFYCVQTGDKKCTSLQLGTYILNGLTITASTGTLTITNLKTASFSNSITIAGTDGSTLNVGTGGTLGTNAFTSTAFAPLASPTFTGTVIIPTPFTLGAVSVTSTGTQLNFLNAATGTTGTVSTNIVFSTSPVLTTPNLGTPSTLVLTNATGTPSAITLTNGTGLPIAGITGLGTGVGTWLATPSSANLIAAITDETGTGALVFGITPTIATPVINGLPTGTGVATANTVSTLVARDSSGNFSAGTITATLTGAASSATTATNATNTAITEDTATNATMFPTWVTANTGNLPQKTTSTKLTFNPSTGVLSSTSFTGAGTGLTGTGASFTAGTVTTNANLTGVITSSGNATSIASQTGTGTKFVVDTSPTIATPTISGAWVATSSQTIGNGTALTSFTINGGTGSGASAGINIQNNGSNGVILGTENFVQGTGSNTKLNLFSSNSTYRFNGLGAGAMTTDASGNVSITSDQTLKIDRGLFQRGIKELKGIQPHLYTWRPESGMETEGVYAGFFAQNVQEFIPEAVGHMADGKLTLADRPIIGALVNAVVQQQKEIDELKAIKIK